MKWLPGCHAIAELLAATPEQRTQTPSVTSSSHVRVTYQGAGEVTWRGETISLVGRTFEEAFALENLVWCQERAQKDLQLRIPRNETKPLAALATAIHNRVKGDSFKKTDFALALLTRSPETWTSPRYIAEGLRWLEDLVTPAVAVTPTEAEIVEEAAQ